jgi:hypothetical protein
MFADAGAADRDALCRVSSDGNISFRDALLTVSRFHCLLLSAVESALRSSLHLPLNTASRKPVSSSESRSKRFSNCPCTITFLTELLSGAVVAKEEGAESLLLLVLLLLFGPVEQPLPMLADAVCRCCRGRS